MKNKQEKPHIVDILFVLVLFGVFTFCALILIILGANIYQNTTTAMTKNFEERTISAYITEKIRQHDSSGCISIEQLEDSKALVFTQLINDSQYGTYIYYYDGALRELLIRKGSNIGSNPLAAGTPILEVNGFFAEYIDPSLLQLRFITTDNHTKTIYISLHSEIMEDKP